ncbi:MAG: phage capsid protein, partial [Alphaproteobacteria bacterium HGW-Alphaproteobacteria-13]
MNRSPSAPASPEPVMTKSKFFRVAVEGATVDGRTIDRKWLEEMAATYNRATYAARVNLEHIRGLVPLGVQSPFGSYGDILSLKTDMIDIDIGGKTEKRLALFAEIEALEPLVALIRKGQKLYTSIEVNPNFAATGKAYLMGLAVTDTPASLGTEMLEFSAKLGANSPLERFKQQPGNHFSVAAETQIDLIDDAPNADPTGILASIAGLFNRFTPPAPVTPPAPAQ